MVYKIYSNRIALLDDAELALAEIDFPAAAGRPGVVEITHTLVDESLRGQGIAGRLMLKLCSVLEKKSLRAVPCCSYAETWFERHPEFAWLLAPAQSFPGEMSSAEEREPGPADRLSPEPDRGAAVHRRSVQSAGDDEEDDDAEENILDRCLTAVSRVLQLFSAFLMLMLMLVFGYAALLKLPVLGELGSMITDRNYAEISFAGLSAGLLFYMLMSLFWMLTRKRYARRDMLYSVDVGRGLTAFLLMLALTFMAGIAAEGLSGLRGAGEGILLAANTLAEHSVLLRQLSLAGLFCCVIRKLLKR